MPQDTTGNWATTSSTHTSTTGANIKVIRRENKPSKGQMIMAIADKIFPRLMAFFKDKRDESGMLLQPAHVRGIALNIAEDLIKNRELKENKS